MARPSKRTSKSYARDIESLTRLRMAVLVDKRIPKSTADETVSAIDNLTNRLREVVNLAEPAD